MSGEKLQERPELMRLLAEVDAGRVDMVVAIDTDRLARDSHVFSEIFRRLDRAEVKVHADGNLMDPEKPQPAAHARHQGAGG